jgi:hypothetical protein
MKLPGNWLETIALLALSAAACTTPVERPPRADDGPTSRALIEAGPDGPVVAPPRPGAPLPPPTHPIGRPRPLSENERRYLDATSIETAGVRGAATPQMLAWVLDADGKAVDDARVAYMNIPWDREVEQRFPFVPTDLEVRQTDGNGKAEFARAGTRAVWAHATAGGRADCAMSFSRGHYRRPDPPELRLGPAIRLRGRIVDASGAPIAGASVELRREFTDRFLDISNTDGVFGDVHVPARYGSGEVRLLVGAAGYLAVDRKVDGKELAGRDFKVVLKRTE